MPQMSGHVNRIPIPPAIPMPLQEATPLQVGDDPLHRPFGDTNLRGNLAHQRVGVTLEADQHVGVIRKKRPRRIDMRQFFRDIIIAYLPAETKMEKLIRGAANFNKNADSRLKDELGRLAANGQTPSTLLITCVDSRVLPSIITNSPPGSMLTLRNVGNFVPSPEDSWVGGDTSVASTLAFGLEVLNIRHIVVMGHSECGGMAELLARRNDFRTDALGTWLRNGRRALQKLVTRELMEEGLNEVNRLSQLNVLNSLEALSFYPEVRARLDRMQLTLHGWWFDIYQAKVLAYEPRAGRFVPVEHAYEATLAGFADANPAR